MTELNRVHLNGLRALEAVGRLGTLQAAADELGVTVGAVSQQVIKTEAQLGRACFRRSGRGLEQTEFGKGFLARLSGAFREIEAALASARQQRDDVLTVSVAPVFASKWLVPRLAGFSRAHPGLRVRLDASVGLVDLQASDVDLAIRVGAGNWPDVDALRLLPQEVFPVCAPALAAALREPRDLLRAPIVRDANANIGWNVWLSTFGLDEAHLPEGHSFTDAALALDAAIGGQGVMLAWQTLAHDAITAGRLVAPFPQRAPTGLGYYLVSARGRRPPPKVEHFRRWIEAELGGDFGG